MNKESEIKVKVKTEGFEEAQESIDALCEAYQGFPANVSIRNCHDCCINIYPSQSIFNEHNLNNDESEKANE